MLGLISGIVSCARAIGCWSRSSRATPCGELTLVDDSPRSLSAVATEPSVLAVIDDKAFVYLVHETPMFALQVMRSMAQRIRERDPQD